VTRSSASPVAGIGGVFLFSERPDALAQWYERHLGLAMEHAPQHGAWFARFACRELESGSERYALFTVLTAPRRLRREGRQFTVNLRVHDLPALVQRLRDAQVKVTDVEEHAEGRLAWTRDPDGNRLELWEDTAV
jgi:catechol 2,3-dioxygenase-like lactoylglutathione lyase family enzyme